MNPTHEQLWAKCLEFIKDNITPQQYDTWFRDITSKEFVDGRLVLCVQSSFFVDQLEERHQGLLRAGIKKVYGDGVQLFYSYPTVGNDPCAVNLQKSAAPSPVILAQSKAQPANPFRPVDNSDFDPQLNPRYTFENYCLSDSNKIARTIGQAIGDNPSVKTFNPLFVFGPSGVGKTHLIQAIGIRIKERNPKARVLYVTARLFQAQYTAASVKDKDINSFFHFYQSIDTLIIDDVQDLKNRPGTQNTFFHIFNHLHQHDRQIIMSSDCAPAEMEGFEARLLSRFKWGMQVELERPDIELRRNVLKQKAEQDGLSLPNDVAEYIATNVTQSVREIEGIVASLLAHAMVLKRDISLDLAQRVISNAVKIQPRRLNFEIITDAVASHFGIKPDLLFTSTRKRQVCDARQVVMYLCKKHVDMSLAAIGSRFGRNHSTVIHGCNAVESRLSIDERFAGELREIETALQVS